MIISNNFKLMRITATQTIAHYSVNFDLIHKSFTVLLFYSCILSGKNFKAIASVIVLVAWLKIANGFLTIFMYIFLNSYKLQLLE